MEDHQTNIRGVDGFQLGGPKTNEEKTDFGEPFSRQIFLVELMRAPIEEPSSNISIALKLNEFGSGLGRNSLEVG